MAELRYPVLYGGSLNWLLHVYKKLEFSNYAGHLLSEWFQ